MKMIIVAVSAIFFTILPSLASEDPAHLKIRLAPSMSNERRAMLQKVLERAGSLEFDQAKTSTLFKKFYGIKKRPLIDYLNDRIKYILDDQSASAIRLMFSPEGIHLGIGLWLSALTKGSKTTQFIVDDEVLAIASPRAGIVQLGAPFFGWDPIWQLGILLHEARHSDCVDLAHALDENTKCGFPHLRGNYVTSDVDKFSWGAYAAQYIFGDAVAQACLNCSEDEKWSGLVVWSDNQSKVHDLDAMNREDSYPDMRGI